mgnify:CR=1 FL=1
MPTLLEQAIIDAQELKEAALKNAESTILEKYNNEVKNVVETLLEQEEDMMGAMEEPPFAAAEKEEMCPCPDENEKEVVTFSLDDLKKMADDLEAVGQPESQEDLMADLGMEPEEETLPLQEEVEVVEEDIDFDEDLIKELVEELVVDVMPVKTGYLATPQGEMQHAEELELARLASTEAQEQMKALKDARDRLTITNESLTSDNRKLVEGILALKEKVEQTLLENAKLLYMNQALNSASLNERQKSKVVESIRKADSVEEAKVIFETLQSAAGSSTSRKPKSLSEAISRPSSTLPRRRKERAQGDTLVKDRFQRLAGLK